RERGRLASGSAGGGVTADDLVVDEHAENLGGVPALRAGGCEHVRGAATQVGQTHAAQQPVQFLGDRWGGGAGHGVVSLSRYLMSWANLASMLISPSTARRPLPGPLKKEQMSS